MPALSDPLDESGSHEVDRLTRRVFLLFGVGVSVAALLLSIWVYVARPLPRHLNIVLVILSVTLVWGGAAWLAGRGRTRLATGIAVLCGVAGVGLFAVLMQSGLQAAALALLPLLVALSAVFTGLRFAVLVSLSSAAMLVGLYALEVSGQIGRAEAAAAIQPHHLLLAQMLPLAAGLLTAILLSRLLIDALRGSMDQERRFRGLLDIGADWYWEQDEQLRFTNLSPSFSRVTGMDAQERLGRRRWEVPGMRIDDAVLRAHRDDLAARRAFRDLLTEQRFSDGSSRYFVVSGQPRFDRLGHFTGYWGVAREVTADVQARQAVQASEERFRSLFFASPVAAVICRAGKILLANEAAARLFKYGDPAPLVGAELTDFFHPRHRDDIRERHARLAASPLGEALPLAEADLQLPDGRQGTVQAAFARVSLTDGPAIQTTFIDLSPIRRAEAALLRSETLLSQIYQTTADGVALIDMATAQVQFINPGLTRQLGYAPTDLIGRVLDDLGVFSDPSELSAIRQQIQQRGEARDIQARLRTRDGRVIICLVQASNFNIGEHHFVLAVLRDVTDAERASRQQQAILDNASIGIAVTRHQRFERVNPSVEAMLGWPPGTLAGESAALIWPSPEEHQFAAHSLLPMLRRGERIDLTQQLRRRDGTLFWSRIRAQSLDSLFAEEGQVVWIVEDISAERDAQEALAAAKEQAEAASRAKSAFLANTSHEIRTPLNAVMGLARLALRADSPAERENYLGRLVENTEALAAIISDILDLSKIEAGKLAIESVAFELPRLIDSVCQMFAETARDRGLQLSARIDPSLPLRVQGDPVRLRQILSNFVANALKFTEHGSVSLQAISTGETRIRFDVLDTGIGLDAETASRLFTPFTQADATTTRRYGGTGLGLSICRELAQLMGGTVGIESEIGRGSRFWVEMPLASARQDEQAPDRTEPFRELAGAHVLLVEDNALNRLIASMMLKSWNIEVTEAHDGESALAIIEARAAAFDLVLMDIHMPGMNGYDATLKLREKYSAQRLPIIALTAAALATEQQRAYAVGMNDFVPKPIDIDQLRTVVSRWVGHRVLPTDN